MAPSQPPASDDRVDSGAPLTFGKYVLERRLAVGGTSEVYLARPWAGTHPASVLVVKRLLPAYLDDAQSVEMFVNEARLHRFVKHPNVVEVYETGVVSGEPFLAMEYVEGVDAFRMLRRAQTEQKPVPAALAVHIARKLCDALGAVHAATDERGGPLNMAHRDVTPSNLYLSHTGEVRLGDFGIAQSTTTRTAKAAPGAVLRGKYNYLAPEQVNGDHSDYRADLFSLTVVLAEMILGRPLFAGSGQLAVLLAIRDCRVDALREAGARLPRGMFAVLERALRKRPDQRYQSAHELSEALAPFEPKGEDQRPVLREWVLWARDNDVIMQRLHGKVRDSSNTLRTTRAIASPSSSRIAVATPSPSTTRIAIAPAAAPPATVRSLTPTRVALAEPHGARHLSFEREAALDLDRPGDYGPTTLPRTGAPLHAATPTKRPEPIPTKPAPKLAGRARAGTIHMRSPAASLRAPAPAVENPFGECERKTAEFDAARTRVRTLAGSEIGPVTFARVIEMIVTGALGAEDEVDLMGDGMRKVREIDLLARHLPDPRTADALEAPAPASRSFDLRTTSLLSALASLTRAKDTGLLLVEGDGTGADDRADRREIYVRNGLLLHVPAAGSSELLGQSLVRRGVLTMAELNMALALLSRFDGRLGDTLIGLGLLDAMQLFQAIQEQGAERVVPLFARSSGRLSFYRGVQPGRVEFPLDLELSHIMLAGLESITTAAAAMTRHKASFDRILRRVPSTSHNIARASMPRPLVALLDGLGSGMALRHLLARLETTSALSTTEVLVALEVGLALGVVEWG